MNSNISVKGRAGFFLSSKLSNNKINIFDIIYIIALIAIGYFYSINATLNALDGDMGSQWFAEIAGNAITLANGEIPLWFPYLWNGLPATGHPFISTFYPITLILQKIHFNYELGFLSANFIFSFFATHIILTILSCYYLFRVLNFNRFVCFISVIIFVFFTSFLSTSGWFSFLSGVAYIPLFIAFSIKLFTIEDKKKWLYVALAGLTLALSGLGQTPPLFMIFAYLIICIFYSINQITDIRKVLNFFIMSVVVAVIGLGISSIYLIPTMEYFLYTVRYIPEMGFVDAMSSKLTYSIFTEHRATIFDVINGFGKRYQWMNMYGFVPILLVMSFFIKTSKNKVVLNFSQYLLFFSFCYTLGFFWTDIFYYLPGFNKLREPFLYSPIFGLAVGFCSAYSLQSLYDLDSFKLSKFFYNPILLVSSVILAIIVLLLPHNNNSYMLILPVVIAICLKLLSIFFMGNERFNLNKKIVNNIFTLAISGLILFSTIYGFKNIAFMYKYKYTWEHAIEQMDKVALSTKRLFLEDAAPTKDPFRTLSWASPVHSSSIMATIGRYDFLAYLNIIRAKTMTIHNKLDLIKRGKIMNIKYFPQTEKTDSFIKNPNFKVARKVDGVYPTLDAEETNTVIMYELIDRPGIAWVVDEFIPYLNSSNVDDIFKVLNSVDFDPNKKVMINTETTDYDLSKIVPTGELIYKTELKRYTANRMNVRIELNKPAILVTPESNYVGWRTYVNGKRVKTVEVNYAFRGVPLDAGVHDVKFKFLPTSFIVGVVIAFFSLMLAISLIVYSVSNFNFTTIFRFFKRRTL